MNTVFADLARRLLRDAITPTWVPYKQDNDYSKEFLIEIGEDNGDRELRVRPKGVFLETVVVEGQAVPRFRNAGGKK